LRIPPTEFHRPVRTATERLAEKLDGVVGVVLYGSVARGEADRRSDIDLWVAVRADRPSNQRAASRVESELESRRLPTNSTRYGRYWSRKPTMSSDPNAVTDAIDRTRTVRGGDGHSVAVPVSLPPRCTNG
jgi:predicted nucleotidyltransferase